MTKPASIVRAAIVAIFLVMVFSSTVHAATATISPQNVAIDTYYSSSPKIVTFTFTGSGVGLPPGASGTPAMAYDIEVNSIVAGGGSCLITQNYISNNVPYTYGIYSNGTQNTDCTSDQLNLAPAYSPYIITFTTYNQTGGGKELASSSTNYYINTNLEQPSVSFSTNALDVGQSDDVVVNWGYLNGGSGTAPFTVSLYSSTSSSNICGGSGTTLIDSANDISTYSTTFQLTPTSSETGTTYYCAKVVDSSYQSPETEYSGMMPLYVAATPSIRLSVKNFIYDVGQPATIGFSLGGGIGPFTVSLISASNSTQIGSSDVLSSPNSDGSLTFNVPQVTGSYSYYVKAIDEETNDGGSDTYSFTSSGSPNAITYTINPILSVPSVSLSSSSAEQGQPFSAVLSWTGGTEPYTANVYVYNSISNSLVTGLTGLTLSGISTDTANIPIQSNELMPGTYYLKAIVSDSNGGEPETNSSMSGNFVITPGPVTTETLDSNSLTYPNFPIVSVKVANGISPYSGTIDIVSQATGSVVESNSISSLKPNTVYAYPTNTLAAGSYFANVIITDSASPAVTVYSSNAFVINKIAPILTLNVPSSFTYNTLNATITASVYPSGLTGNLIMSANGGTGVSVALLTATSNTLTYNAPAAAGSYSFTLVTDANSIYEAESTTANYVISKYNANAFLTVSPSNSFTYDGSNSIINYGLTTYLSNTLGVNLYVNNALVHQQQESAVSYSIRNISEGSNYGYYGAALSQNGTYIYSTSYYDNLITVINAKTGSVSKNIALSGLDEPTGIVIPNNSGNAYITNYLNGTVAVLNLSTSTVTKDIPLSSNSAELSSIEPYYIAASLNGSILYVTDYGTGNLSVISTATDSVIKTLPVSGPSSIYPITLSQNGNTIYVAGGTSLYAINSRTYAVDTISLSPYITKPGSELVTIGSNLYIPADTGEGLTIYNTSTGSLSDISGVLGYPISALGGNIYISNYTYSTINGKTYVINASTGKEIGSVNNGAYRTFYSVAADGNVYLINYEYNFTEIKNPLINVPGKPITFNFSYFGPATPGTYSLKAAPLLFNNYTYSNVSATLEISPKEVRALSAIPSNSVYNGKNFTITAYNSNMTTLGLNATLNGNKIITHIKPYKGISTVPFYAGAEAANGTVYFTTDSNTVYYYPEGPGSSNGIIYLPNGIESYSIAISNATDYAYITSYLGNTISVFDLATNTLLNSIVLPGSSSEAVYDILSKNDSALYVSNYGTNSVDAINLATNAITPISLDSGSDPTFMTLSPSGKHLYVSGYYENVYVINTTNNALQHTITTPVTKTEYVGQTSISSNGEYLYIPVYEDEYVEVYDTNTQTVVKSIYVYYPYVTTVSGGKAYLFSHYPYDPSYGFVVLNTTTNNQVGSLQTVPFYEDPHYAFTGKNSTVYLIGPYGYESEIGNYSALSMLSHIPATSQYSLPAAAGTYTLDFQTTNSNYTAIGVSDDIYTISKAIPGMHLLIPNTSFVYTGNAINATFYINNISNKLAGTLSLNGNVIDEYNPNTIGQVETYPVNAISIGNYQLEFSTGGNGNYTSANVIDDFVISGAAAQTSISVPHSFVYNGSNAIITASIYPANALGNLYMSVNSGNYVKVASTTASSNTLTFNAPAVAGNYSFEFYNTANTLYAEGFSIGNYSIYKAVPGMSFPQSCGSYTVDGLSCNTIANVSTIGNQITASLYVNGTLVGTTSNTITYVGSNAINTYDIVFNTTGNENYSVRSISYSYSIHSHSSGSSSSTSTTTTVTTTAPYSSIPSTSTVTTTIPQKTLNISSSKSSYSGGFSVSDTAPYNVSFANENLFIKFVSDSNKTAKANFTISNYTRTLPNFPGHMLYKAIDLNFTSSTMIIANITMHYNCSSTHPVAPYIFENGSLVKISDYTVYPLSCSINFEVSADPIIALYENVTTKAVPTTSIVPTTTIAPVPQHNVQYDYIIVAIIIIVIAAIAAYAFRSNGKRRGK